MIARWVEEATAVESSPPGTLHDVSYLPDGRVHLVFRLLADGRADLSVRGPLTRAHYKRAAALPACARVSFRAGGAYPFFGVPVDELTNRLVLLESLWGRDANLLLERCVAEVDHGGDATPVILAALGDRMRRAPFEHASARTARAAMQSLALGEPVAHVARTLGVSERHLRRAFTSTVGYSPKAFSRVARFQRALSLLRERRADLGSIAGEAGYSDQAHLNHEFRALSSQTPLALVRGEAPARGNCQGSV
ncbi:MAG: helix-turn-helix transcriptional regulator [Archangium sp.]